MTKVANKTSEPEAMTEDVNMFPRKVLIAPRRPRLMTEYEMPCMVMGIRRHTKVGWVTKPIELRT